jgi:D-3-phosphoglycerate dehydrogenase
LERPKIIVVETQDFSHAALEKLRSIGDVDLGLSPKATMESAFGDYDIVWFRLAHRITTETIGRNPRCRVLATPVTGLDHIDLEACRQRGIQVVSLKGEVDFLRTVRATAELTVALAFALLRKIPAATHAVRHGTWNRDLFRGNELFGKTVGIVGLGRLGTLVAGYFRAFGMHVLGYDIRPDFPREVAERAATLIELLQHSDLVTLHITYDQSTRHLIGEPQFDAMRRRAVLINTSRGGVVDESALLQALQSGRIAGAALDVLDGEPKIDATHPLIDYAAKNENLLITPHIGGNTVESFANTELFLANKVVQLFAAA